MRRLLSVLLIFPALQAQDFRDVWRDRYGTEHTRNELGLILASNQEWVASGGERGRPADLMGADIGRLDIDGLDFSGALLRRANFDASNLKRAIFTDADLYRATFRKAMLQGVVARGARAFGADFSGAKLTNSDFTDADLTLSNLRDTEILDVELSGADMWMADVEGSRYEAKSPPQIDTMATARNLGEIRCRFPPGLIELRKGFRDLGFGHQADIITSVIERSKLRCDLLSLAKVVLFDAPGNWGVARWRPLMLVLALGSLGAVCNFVALRTGTSRTRSGIYRSWIESRDPSRPKKDGEYVETERLSFPRREWGFYSANMWLAVGIALFFSQLSIFQMAGKKLNLGGNWFAPMLSSDYALFAMGWVRVVAGGQSVLCLYLLAFWLATFLGHPWG